VSSCAWHAAAGWGCCLQLLLFNSWTPPPTHPQTTHHSLPSLPRAQTQLPHHRHQQQHLARPRVRARLNRPVHLHHRRQGPCWPARQPDQRPAEYAGEQAPDHRRDPRPPHADSLSAMAGWVRPTDGGSQRRPGDTRCEVALERDAHGKQHTRSRKHML